VNLVVDASALVCLLLDESGAGRVAELLFEANLAEIHSVNLLEVHYRLLRDGQQAYAMGRSQIEALGLTVVWELDEPMMRVAAELKAFRAPIALGDVVAVALAVTHDAALLTTDRAELQKIREAGLCEIEFVR